jgi:hypothetical protein
MVLINIPCTGLLMSELAKLGSRQVVRHRILIPAFVGSIPTSPAKFKKQVRNN